MWFLIVIILSQPYTVIGVEVLGKYCIMDVCEKEKTRALEIGLPHAHSAIACLYLDYSPVSD